LLARAHRTVGRKVEKVARFLVTSGLHKKYT